MVSITGDTRLSAYNKELIINNLRDNFNYAPRYLKCPMTSAEQVSLANNLLPVKLLDAYTAVTEYGLKLEALTNVAVIGIDLGGDQCSILRLYPDKVSPLIYVMTLFRSNALERAKIQMKTHDALEWYNNNDIMRVPIFIARDVAHILGEPLFEELITWTKACDLIGREIHDAVITIEEIFNLAATTGQLVRMVPEFIEYVLPEHRKLLDQQSRRSSTHKEWPMYDKTRVENMLNILHRCYLLKSIVTNHDELIAFGQRNYPWGCIREIV